ncbi:FecR family protein [Deminuibacter soli]|uniref:FecR family protein n=1 Tax=Deminuibacter soli TaxID=2291815 RepID=A0A3E1NDZ0_9BACT|nr:FecR domain-containing protein [Deminuibacter soli]RFM26176.1 FecR family protein [Deminuibacter soli]
MAKKNKNRVINDEVLARYITGESGEAESETVRHWLDSDEKNRRYYEIFLQVSSYAQSGIYTDHIDEEAEWRTFRANIAGAGVSLPVRKVWFHQKLVRIAAIFVLVSGLIAFYLLESQMSGPKKELLSGQAVLTEIMPDGSRITLNKGSVLYYTPSSYNKKRHVQLTGEAFFSVAPNREIPFVIDLPGTVVEVVGTSFNIKMTDNKTEIIVETGAVQVKKGNMVFHLLAKEKVTLYKDDMTAVKQVNADSLYSYYRTKKFVCKGTPVRELIVALNNTYDTHISLQDDKDGDMPITVTFMGKTITEILPVICSTLQLTMVEHGNTVILKKRSGL